MYQVKIILRGNVLERFFPTFSSAWKYARFNLPDNVQNHLLDYIHFIKDDKLI